MFLDTDTVVKVSRY